MKKSFRVAVAILAVVVATISICAQDAPRKTRRHTTPIETAATTTQAINETRDDTSRINAAFRARSTHYHRDDGAIVYVDTVNGIEWVDSATIVKSKKMKYPLVYDATLSVDIWDPVMRIFGQSYGLTSFAADINLHNRYFPTFEVGIGQASIDPSGKNYHYTSPLSVFFKLGANYNFIYNSNPAYKFFAGVRYGFAPFRWSLNATPAPGYWGDTPPLSVPSINVTSGWLEIGLGLRVRLWRNLSAGWMFKYHMVLHQSKSVYGKPLYIPGYGATNQAITGSFTLSYTLPLAKEKTTFITQMPEIK